MGRHGCRVRGRAAAASRPALASPSPLPYPAAIVGDSDGGCCRLVEGQLFPVGPKETDGAAMVSCSFIQPGGRVLAGVCEALAGCGTQQLQEGQLYHTHRGSVSIHVGELEVGQRGGEGTPFASTLSEVPTSQDLHSPQTCPPPPPCPHLYQPHQPSGHPRFSCKSLGTCGY